MDDACAPCVGALSSNLQRWIGRTRGRTERAAGASAERAHPRRRGAAPGAAQKRLFLKCIHSRCATAPAPREYNSRLLLLWREQPQTLRRLVHVKLGVYVRGRCGRPRPLAAVAAALHHGKYMMMASIMRPYCPRAMLLVSRRSCVTTLQGRGHGWRCLATTAPSYPLYSMLEYTTSSSGPLITDLFIGVSRLRLLSPRT